MIPPGQVRVMDNIFPSISDVTGDDLGFKYKRIFLDINKKLVFLMFFFVLIVFLYTQ